MLQGNDRTIAVS